MRLLLLSNSTNSGEDYMAWCSATIAEFLKGAGGNPVFIPYAAVGFSYDSYTDRVNQSLQQHGIEVKGIHSFKDPKDAIKGSSAILVGGGNTFHLLRELENQDIVELIQEKAEAGVPYIGWSAGSNVAGKTIRTTNDMPIVEPMSFNALELIPYQINPHYTDKTIPNHGGESRMQRLLEFVAANDQETVICLPESSYLIQDGAELKYQGKEPESC